MTANTTFVANNVLTAAQMNALPWGIVDTTAGGTSGRGYYNKTNGNYLMPVYGSIVVVPNLTMTFTPVTGRLYKASYSLRSDITTAQLVYTQFRIGSSIYAGKADGVAAGSNQTIANFYVFSGLTTSTTIEIFAAVQSVSAGSNLIFASDTGCTFSIEDIGPA